MNNQDNSIDKIIQAISQEGKAEVDRIMENAKKNVEEVEKLYEKEAALDREEIMGKAEKEVREIEQRSLSQMGMEARNARLAAKQEVIDHVFARVEERLEGLPFNEKKELYQRLIQRYAGSHEVTVQLNKRDGELFRGKLNVSGIAINYHEEAGGFLGGLVLKEGPVEIACTFEALIKEARESGETEIAEMLFA